MDALTHEVVLGGQEQHRHIEIAVVVGGLGVGRVDRVIHIPRRGTEETVPFERSGIDTQVLFGDHIDITRQIGDLSHTKHTMIATSG